jgi:hypothetical protein
MGQTGRPPLSERLRRLQLSEGEETLVKKLEEEQITVRTEYIWKKKR